MNQNSDITLAQGIALFLQRGHSKHGKPQQELNKFTRWFQGSKRLGAITPGEIQSYAEQLPAGASQNEEHLKPIRQFLLFVKKEGLVSQNFSLHLRPRRLLIRGVKTANKTSPNLEMLVKLTKEGYLDLQNQLTSLRDELPLASREIQRAAADKDVRENAPLDAAKDNHGKLAARIQILEDTMAKAVILDKSHLDTDNKVLVQQGSKVTVVDLSSSQQFTWTLVDPREANLSENKLSISSPVGHAILGSSLGDEVEVSAPSRKVVYRIGNIS